MTPGAALRTATCDSARYLQRPDLGRIAPGLCGDAILLVSNPLESIEVLRTPAVVIKAGEIVCDYRSQPVV